MNIHDPGFVVRRDPEGSVVGRPRTRSRSRSASPFPSSTLSELDIDNQENIPPPLLPSTSACSISIPDTPHSQSGGSTSTSSRVDSYLCTFPSTVSPSSHHHWSPYSRSSHGHTPGSRKREQSKLVNELLLLRGEDVPSKTQIKTRARTESESGHRHRKMEEVIIQDELTPGRRTTRGMARRGKDLLAKEVDGV